ncbi:MAG: hypothetical protein LBT08_00070 [Synergistaceae bacterium]|jgi:hypothetical protein|nr:hypothetical protein [Synergistaceae bacterium]
MATAEIERVCGSCSSVMPPGWSQIQCPVCGGRVRLNIKQKKPAKVLKRSIKGSVRDHPLAPVAAQSSALGPRFLTMSPMLLFILNILTLGLRSVFWVNYHLPSLIAMARGTEMLKRSTLSIWLTARASFLTFLGAMAWEFLASAFDTSAPTLSWLLRGAAVALIISLLIDRYVLFWVRNVIMDTLEKSDHDVVKVRTVGFAQSPLMLWFIGVPYIQFHINRMIKKKGLQSYGAARRQRQVDAWLAARGAQGDGPPRKSLSRYLKNSE